MGADSLADFPNWREPQRICELATLLVVQRAGLKCRRITRSSLRFYHRSKLPHGRHSRLNCRRLRSVRATSANALLMAEASGTALRAVEMLITDRKLYKKAAT